MKTNRFINLLTAAVGLAAFSSAGCTEKQQTADATPPPGKEATTATATVVVPKPATTVQVAATVIPDVASARWTDIKDCTYDMRAQFFAGLNRLEARVDVEVSELTTRRAAMNSNANTQDWDFAMKEMERTRSYLKSTGDDLSKSSPATWDQIKDKVGEAWVKTQDAYRAVKSSTTS
jgi:hypothetical protein